VAEITPTKYGIAGANHITINGLAKNRIAMRMENSHNTKRAGMICLGRSDLRCFARIFTFQKPVLNIWTKDDLNPARLNTLILSLGLKNIL
jgi:hypothetical protein